MSDDNLYEAIYSITSALESNTKALNRIADILEDGLLAAGQGINPVVGVADLLDSICNVMWRAERREDNAGGEHE